METIWQYLGFKEPVRTEKKTVHLVLESGKLNPTQRKRMQKTGYLSEKLDGVYSLVTFIDGEVRHWGRSGKALSNCEGLDRYLYLMLEGATKDLVFISEITSEDPLAKLSGYLTPSRVKQGTFQPTGMKDNFHDLLTIEEFIQGVSTMPFSKRHHELRKYGLNHIPIFIRTIEAAKKNSNEWIKRGKEGGVYAQDAPWTAGKRDESLIKFKEKLSFDLVVVDGLPGKKGSKYEHTLGKLVVLFKAFGKQDGDSLEIPISGMSDSERDLWWKDPSSILGKVVKVDAKSYTENGNLREPRFKEVREDKSTGDFE